MKKLIIFYLLFLNSLFCFSQSKEFSYMPTNKDSLTNFIKKISSNKIIKLGKKHEKDVKKIVEERRDHFIKSIEDSTFIFDKKISKYLKNILSEIYTKNNLKNTNDFYFFIDKSPIPNAACYGNGIFSINLGLLNWVENDDELAFILSHEIAHYALEHNDKSLINYVETLNSKETKEQFKKIKKQEFGKRKAYSELIKNLSYNFLRRSRKVEIQADSLGTIFYNKTKFNKKASISALEKLRKSDDMIFNEDTKIKEHFNFESYPFKDAWLTREENLFDLKESSNDYAFDKDSLKTHPDIPVRIETLQKVFKTNSTENNYSKEVDKIKNHVSENSISIFINDNKLDLGIYQTLVLYNKKEIDEKTYSILIATFLQKIYETKLNHTFGKYIESPSPFSDEKYLNEIKIFLTNLELKNIRKIGHAFCSKYSKLMHEDKNFVKIEEFFKTLNI